MIVNKPIAAIKINRIPHTLTVGKPVPKIVLDYLKKTGALKPLMEMGAISDEKKVEKVKVKDESTVKTNS